MRIFLITSLLLISTKLVIAQTIDCSVYQSQVSDLTSEINNAIKSRDKAQSSLENCDSIGVILKSPEYQSVISAKEQAQAELQASAITSQGTIK